MSKDRWSLVVTNESRKLGVATHFEGSGMWDVVFDNEPLPQDPDDLMHHESTFLVICDISEEESHKTAKELFEAHALDTIIEMAKELEAAGERSRESDRLAYAFRC